MTAAPSNLAMQIGQLCRLDGEFRLRSGTAATTYFDKYLFEADPAILRAVAEELSQLVPADTDVLAGLELGGVPVVTALSLATDLPAAFVRKVAKPYGTAKLAEGAAIDGRKVLVVEDVITTGGQVGESTRDLRDRGAVVDAVLCVIDRSDGDHPVLDDEGIDQSSGVRPGGTGTNSKATWSLVLGVLSVTVCGFLVAIGAIILGKQAQLEIAESGGLQGGASRARWGIILGWISLVIYVIAAIIALIALMTN
jgi:orotate phosphoribosyltransferase